MGGKEICPAEQSEDFNFVLPGKRILADSSFSQGRGCGGRKSDSAKNGRTSSF